MPMYSGACVMPFIEIDNTGHVLSWLGKKIKVYESRLGILC